MAKLPEKFQRNRRKLADPSISGEYAVYKRKIIKSRFKLALLQVKQSPFAVKPKRKTEFRSQFGALCYRIRKEEVQVLLITSRETKRWIIPKGWPMAGEKPAEAASTEAFEEAGVTGKSSNLCIGLYSYKKRLEGKKFLPVVVSVFPVRVKNLHSTWPEKEVRRRKWFSLEKAAKKVKEPELQKIIKFFDPDILER